jgi:murein DD-endopeptidase MepM/ murein hydrolase activator NlpD
MQVKRAFSNRRGSFLACFLLGFLVPARAELPSGAEGPSVLPLISRLDSRDTLFVQYQADVEYSRRRVFGRSPVSEEDLAGALTIYRYAPREGEDLFSVAARCNIPYAGLASLNRMSHPSLLPEGELLLPSMPGIFVPLEPDSGLEMLLASARASRGGGVDIRLNLGAAPGLFRFFPGDDYGPTERIFFLNRGFRFPLRSYTLTSGFGPRINPVTGRFRVHEGLDLAAPMGTDVFAVDAGMVTETGSDPIYGNYVVVKHGDSWASLYGHLSQIDVVLRQELRSGSVIGKVGSTGQSTGPHLHFELRRNGQAQDPGKFLFN